MAREVASEGSVSGGEGGMRGVWGMGICGMTRVSVSDETHVDDCGGDANGGGGMSNVSMNRT